MATGGDRKRNDSPCEDSAPKRQMVNEPRKDNVHDVEKLKKLVALTASVKIEAGESASFLNETKISIGLAGDPSAGKSSLLNALLGTAAMPMAGISCTAYPVKVQKVARSEQLHKYKLVLPQPADLYGTSIARIVAEKTLGYFSGKAEPTKESRIIETDDIQMVYAKLHEDFKKLISGSNLCYHVNAELTVAEDDPLGLVLLDTPGPVTSYVDWVRALTKLDGSSTPLVILPISCRKAEMCGGAFAALCDEKRGGNLSRLKIIVVFTGIDEPFQCEGTSFKDQLERTIDSIKRELGDSVIHFALVQCMQKGLGETDFSAHRLAEIQTLANLPDDIKNYPGMIKGVPELEKVLMRLYMERWDYMRLGALQCAIDRDIQNKKATLAKMTKPITSDSVVLQLAKSIALTDQQAENTSCVYSKEILRYAYDILKGVDFDPVARTSFVNAIFARTQVQLEFQNEEMMRQTVQNVLRGLATNVPAVIDEMFKQYETYVSCQVSACPNSCAQLLERVLALLKEFATGTFEEPGAIAKATEEAQKWFDCTPSVTKLRDGLKTDYKLDLPEKWSVNKGPLAQRMLSELSFVMDRLHWVVCSIFFREICAAFPSWLNARLARTAETWSSASREEIETAQKAVDSLVKTRGTLDEIMKLLR